MSDASDLKNPDGSGNSGHADPPKWTAQFPDDLKKPEVLTSFSKYGTLGDLGKAHLEQGKRLAELEGKLKNALYKPGENASDEERAAWRRALGVPDTEDGYAFDKPALPEGYEYAEEDVAAFRAKARELGLTAEQAKGIFELDASRRAAELKRAEEILAQHTKKVTEELKKNWGDEYAANMNMIGALGKKYGSQEIAAYMDASGRGNDPVFLNFMLALAKDFVGAGILEGTSGGGPGSKGGLSYPWMREAYPEGNE